MLLNCMDNWNFQIKNNKEKHVKENQAVYISVTGNIISVFIEEYQAQLIFAKHNPAKN